MIEVWRIDNDKMPSNGWTVDREEYWVPKLDSTFTTHAEAASYVIEMNIKHSDVLLYTTRKTPKEASEFIHGFCFGPNHCDKRRYWLGQPDIRKIREQLKAMGVKFIKQ